MGNLKFKSSGVEPENKPKETKSLETTPKRRIVKEDASFSEDEPIRAKHKRRGEDVHYIKSPFFGGDELGTRIRIKPYGWIIFSIVVGFILAFASFILYEVYENKLTSLQSFYSKQLETLVRNIKFYSSLVLIICLGIWAILVLTSLVNMLIRASATKQSPTPFKATAIIVLGFFVLGFVCIGIWSNTVNLNFDLIDGNKNIFEYLMLILRFNFPFLAAIFAIGCLGAFGRVRKNRAL